MIGETFRDMAQRMEELERLHRAQGRRAKLWMAVAALILLLLLFGTFFGYRSHRQLLSVSRANTELKQEAVNTNQQLQMLHRQSIELVAFAFKKSVKFTSKVNIPFSLFPFEIVSLYRFAPNGLPVAKNGRCAPG